MISLLLLGAACGSDGGGKDAGGDKDKSDGGGSGDGPGDGDGDKDGGGGRDADGGGDGGGPGECGSMGEGSDCSLREDTPYGKCIAEHCNEQFTECVGEDFSSGVLSGPCGDFFTCINGCCDDDACIDACGTPSLACIGCLIPAGICATAAGCEAPSCLPGPGG